MFRDEMYKPWDQIRYISHSVLARRVKYIIVDMQIFVGTNFQGLNFQLGLNVVGRRDPRKIMPTKNKTHKNNTHRAL